MTNLYIKVPPIKQESLCVFKFTDLKRKKYKLTYTSLIMFSDDHTQNQWLNGLQAIRLPYHKFLSETGNNIISMVVTEPNCRENEIVFDLPLINPHPLIPIVDQMICTFYKIPINKFTYTKIIPKPNIVSETILIDLLGKDINKLTKAESKVLGLKWKQYT